MKKIVIIGGGISGLSTLYYLKKKLGEKKIRAHIRLLEKSGRFGGQIRTEYVDGFIIDGGSDCFIREKPWALSLCRELGIEDRLVNTMDENNGTFIYRKGKLHSLPEGLMSLVPARFLPFITSGLFSLAGKIRMGIEVFIPRRKDDSDETLARFVTRRSGRELLDMIAEPLIAGIHAGDPDRMSVKSTFPRFIQMEKEHGSLTMATLAARKKMKEMMKKHSASGAPQRSFFISFRRGMYQFIETLLEKLKDQNLMTGIHVTAVKKEKNGKYRIILEKGKDMTADMVVVTTPAYVSAGILKGVSRPMAESMKKIPYVKTGTISIAYRKQDVEKFIPKAFGFLIPGVEKRSLMAATFTSRKWPGRCPEDYVLIRCFIGGKHNQELIGKDDETIMATARRELQTILGITAEPYLYRIYRWIDNMPQYNIGHMEIMETIDREMEKNRGLYVTGSAYRGIGIPDCIQNAEITAEKISASLSS